MDIRSYFGGSNSPSTSSISSEAESDVDSRNLEVNAPKKFCKNKSLFAKKRNAKRAHYSVSKRKYCTNWENDFPWLEYDEDYRGAFCKACRRYGKITSTNRRSMGYQAIYKLEESCREDKRS